MSDTEARSEWHLTSEGWVKGRDLLYGPERAKPVPIPAARLETWEAEYRVCSQYGTPVGVVAERSWFDEDTSEGSRAAWREKYPSPWSDFGGWLVEKGVPDRAE